MSEMNINDVLQQIRHLSDQASQKPRLDNEAQPGQFQASLKSAIDSVSDAQSKSGELRSAFEQGDPSVSLAQVMVASQKSSIAFQAMVNVRNKVVQAYKDVMNMPI